MGKSLDVEIRVGGGGGRRRGVRRAAGKGGTVEFAGLVENVRLGVRVGACRGQMSWRVGHEANGLVA